MRTAPLTLRALPTLLTDCVIVGHAQKADVVFTPPQWFAMCAHMHNENPDNFFMTPFRGKDGKAKFAKAYHANVGKRVEWAWNTITDQAKEPGSIGFYPTNSRKQSRWGAMDFDAHDGNTTRARDLSHKAFALLIREPQLYIALCTSAGDPHHSGWHLFIFTREFFPCGDWTRLLKQVAAQIEATIQPGLCEIFPDDCKGIGRGIRAPGSWSPKSGECGLIQSETVTRLLPSSLPLPKENSVFLNVRSTTRGDFASLPNSKFKITAPGTRHAKMLELVGALFLQCGREVARKTAELQHAEASPAPVASLEEHLAEFDQAWAGIQRHWLRKLTPAERIKFDALITNNEREAFRIIRNWSQTDDPDFKVHCKSLAHRLGITLQGASNLRRRFCGAEILKQTAQYVPHRLAARYKWIAGGESKREQAALVSTQWNGDPGDADLKRRATYG
jgi:hypothetical protein